MQKLNKIELEQSLQKLWEKRDSLTSQEFSQEAQNLYAQFEMRIDDLISHLTEIREWKGNIKVLQKDLNSGTLRLVNVHVQKRNDSNDEWVLSIY